MASTPSATKLARVGQVVLFTLLGGFALAACVSLIMLLVSLLSGQAGAVIAYLGLAVVTTAATLAGFALTKDVLYELNR